MLIIRNNEQSLFPLGTVAQGVVDQLDQEFSVSHVTGQKVRLVVGMLILFELCSLSDTRTERQQEERSYPEKEVKVARLEEGEGR